MSHRLKKSERLLKRWDFTQVQSRGVKVYGAYCLIIALPGETPQDRVGIVITKKIHKHAVRRNRFKRQVREAFRTMAGRLTHSIASGNDRSNDQSIDGVVIARPAALGASTDKILKDVQNTWNEVNKRCQAQALRGRGRM